MQKSDEQRTGVIFNIQKYSVHDGPGIRTVVFLKGCPLRCSWCSNPESQSLQPELAYNETKCLGVEKCQRCIVACPHQVISPDPATGKIKIDREHCKHCVAVCTDICVAHALISYGHETTVDAVLQEVEKDMAFYSRSGGGITLSGGEPLMQKEFALALLRESRKRRIKTNIETCAQVGTDVLLEAAGMLNHIMFDIKHADAGRHKEETGQENTQVLKNFAALVEAYPKLPMVVRTPVIPGFNDSVECIRAIATLVKEKQRINPGIRYELLPYHRLGTQKYLFLDRAVPMVDIRLDQNVFARLQHEAASIVES